MLNAISSTCNHANNFQLGRAVYHFINRRKDVLQASWSITNRLSKFKRYDHSRRKETFSLAQNQHETFLKLKNDAVQGIAPFNISSKFLCLKKEIII
jgi:hypothetical protein